MLGKIVYYNNNKFWNFYVGSFNQNVKFPTSTTTELIVTCAARSRRNFVYQREQRDVRVGYQRGFKQVGPLGSIYSIASRREYIITKGYRKGFRPIGSTMSTR